MTAEPVVTSTERFGRADRPTRAITCAWMVLCAITVGSWWLAPGHAGDSSGADVVITMTVIVLGCLKGRLILRYFMEVRSAPTWLKVATDAWLFALWAAIGVIYLL